MRHIGTGPLRETIIVVVFLLANFIDQSNVVLTINLKINVIHGEPPAHQIISTQPQMTGVSGQFSVILHNGNKHELFIHMSIVV